MKIKYAKKFRKALYKLSKNQRQKTRQALDIFEINPFDDRLHNHKLKGKRAGIRSISAGYDLRILYHEKGGHLIVLVIDVGSHDQVYRH